MYQTGSFLRPNGEWKDKDGDEDDIVLGPSTSHQEAMEEDLDEDAVLDFGHAEARSDDEHENEGNNFRAGAIHSNNFDSVEEQMREINNKIPNLIEIVDGSMMEVKY